MWKLALMIFSVCGPLCADSCLGSRQPHDNKAVEDALRTHEVIHFATVACGGEFYAEEAVNLLKSVMVFAERSIHLHIFTDDHLKEYFTEQVNLLTESTNGHSVPVSYTIHDARYPGMSTSQEEVWRKMFGACASLKLFLPTLMPNNDYVIYLDCDIILLRRIDDLLRHLLQFNSTQIAALVQEHEDPDRNWYGRYSRAPFVPPLGINAGVVLMNLTRMRAADWQNKILHHYQTFGVDVEHLQWYDQDLLNIFFHFQPEKLYQIGCEWNYRTDHCDHSSNCKGAERNGVNLLHGSRRVFNASEKQPIFRAVYDAMREVPFGSAMEEDLLARIDAKFVSYPSEPDIEDCRPHKEQLTKSLVTAIGAKKEANSKSKVDL